MKHSGKTKKRITALSVAMMLSSTALITCSADVDSEDGIYVTTIERARGAYTPSSSTRVTLEVENDTATLFIDDREETTGSIDKERGLFHEGSQIHPFQFHKNGNITMTYEGTLMRFTKSQH